jgi:hypothetical protein
MCSNTCDFNARSTPIFDARSVILELDFFFMTHHLPGRLGDPNQTLCADPRTHAAVRQLLLSLHCGMDLFQPAPGTERASMPLEQLLAAVADKERLSEQLFDAMSRMAPPVAGVVDSVEVRALTRVSR